MPSSCIDETQTPRQHIPSPSLGVFLPFPPLQFLFPLLFPLPSSLLPLSRIRVKVPSVRAVIPGSEGTMPATPTPPACLQRHYRMYGTARDGHLIWQSSSCKQLLPSFVKSVPRTTSLGRSLVSRNSTIASTNACNYENTVSTPSRENLSLAALESAYACVHEGSVCHG